MIGLASFYPALQAVLALSSLGRPEGKPALGQEDWLCLRSVLVRGRATPDDIARFHDVASKCRDRLVGAGPTAAPFRELPNSDIEFTVHPSAHRCVLEEGLYAGRTLGWLAANDRAYLFFLASDRWSSSPGLMRSALEALLGLPISSWSGKVMEEVESGADVGIEDGEPPSPSSVGDTPSPEGPELSSASVARQPYARVEAAGDHIVVSFPFDESLVQFCRSIEGARWDRDLRAWTFPLESAVRLVEAPRILLGNEAVLLPLAERYRDELARRAKLREDLAIRRIGTADEIAEARCEKHVVRHSSREDRVVARFSRQDEIASFLYQRAGARWNKSARGHVLEEKDLPAVAEFLWHNEFVFEDVLVESVRRARQRLEELVARARAWSHPLRGAQDAALEYIAANEIEPRAYQRADIVYALDCLREHGGVGLWLDMGLGKTVVTTAVYDILRRQIPGLRALVLCPRSAFSSWRREMSGMLPSTFFFSRVKTGEHGLVRMQEALQRPADEREVVGVILAGKASSRSHALVLGPDIVVVNYDSARSSIDELREWVNIGGPVLMICDESHRIKDPKTKTSKMVFDLISSPLVVGRIALSGTPMPQGAHEFYNQAAFIDGGYEKCRFGESWHVFIDRYFHIKSGKDRRWFRVGNFRDSACRDEFMALVAFATVRRTKEEALDLPDKTYQLLEIEFENSIELEAYRFFAQQVKKDVEIMDDAEVERIDLGRLFMRMRQMTSHPGNVLMGYREALESKKEADRKRDEINAEISRLLVSGGADDKLIERLVHKRDNLYIKNQDLLEIPQSIIAGIEAFVAEKKIPSKLTLLVDLVEDILADPTEKIIVGCDYNFTERAIVEALESYRPIWFSSDLNDEERSEAERAFQNDPSRRVLIAKSQVIAEGLTLTAARHLVLYDPATNYSTKTWLQVQDRIYRLGQTRNVIINHLVVSNTIDLYGISRVLWNAKKASRLLRDAVSSLPRNVGEMLAAGRNFTSKREMLRLLDALSGSDGRE